MGETAEGPSPKADVSALLPVAASPQYTAEYLAQLLKDKKQLAAFPNVFTHLDRLVDEEVSKVRVSLFQFEFNKHGLELPENDGTTVQTIQEKVYVPVQDHPEYNFVGRILGPRGMTAKQLEQETGCKIMVRGKGSMRDKKKEEANRGKPNWEHLSDELHVLIQCEDTASRCKVKLQRATMEINKLLVPAPEGEDELKRKQLMELAIINGTYRAGPGGAKGAGRLMPQMTMASPLRSPTLGAPIILSPGRTAASSANTAAAAAALYNSQAALQGLLPQQFQAGLFAQPAQQTPDYAAAAQGLMFNGGMSQEQMQQLALMQQAAMYPGYAGLNTALQSPLLAQAQPDYAGLDSFAGAVLNQRRLLGQSREHPYQRGPNSLKTPTT